MASSVARSLPSLTFGTVMSIGLESTDAKAIPLAAGVGSPPRICRITRLAEQGPQIDDRSMYSTSHRRPFLLACAVALAVACSGGTPAMAACSPGATDKPDLAFKDSNCDGID